MKFAVAESIVKGLSYLKYRMMVSKLLKEGKSTGVEQSEFLLHYSELNEARMNRLDKKMVITEEIIQKLFSLKRNYIWLLITEGWCGDAAQILPIVNKMASIAPNVELKIVLRDENEALMNQFLTNGAKSIPKLVIIESESNTIVGNWGPRPKGASDLISSYKRQYGTLDDTAKTELQMWYNKDKGISTQKEIADLMTDLETLLHQKR